MSPTEQYQTDLSHHSIIINLTKKKIFLLRDFSYLVQYPYRIFAMIRICKSIFNVIYHILMESLEFRDQVYPFNYLHTQLRNISTYLEARERERDQPRIWAMLNNELRVVVGGRRKLIHGSGGLRFGNRWGYLLPADSVGVGGGVRGDAPLYTSFVYHKKNCLRHLNFIYIV